MQQNIPLPFAVLDHAQKARKAIQNTTAVRVTPHHFELIFFQPDAKSSPDSSFPAESGTSPPYKVYSGFTKTTIQI